ncbi:MAG TPA: hypothetical protein VFK40_00475 [Nitrososphaeraceae archaeon]|nr:hypothetical protein [Nitrososphaeraceae archaeon]
MLKQEAGKCLLAASQGFKEAYKRQEKYHSIFTYYLLECLKGHKDAMDNEGNVTHQSLGYFVTRAIENRPLAERPKQPRIKKVRFSDKIILANYPRMYVDTSLKKEKKDKIKGNRKVNIWIDKH